MIINKQEPRLSTFKFPQVERKSINKQVNDQQKMTDFSRATRFNNQQREGPGPGSYDSNFREKHTSDFHVIKEKVFKQGIAKQHQWILDNQRLAFALVKFQNKKLGPGRYQYSSNLEDSHSRWAKGQRFSNLQKTQINVGPGSYDQAISLMQKRQKAKPLSVFKSKAPKTFFQQIDQKNRKSIVQHSDNPEDSLIIRQNDGIQLIYKPNKSRRKAKVNLSSMFKSKCQRSSIILQSSTQGIGPGSYQVSSQSQMSQKLREMVAEMHNNLDQTKKITNTDRSLPLASKIRPGPGSYNLSSISIISTSQIANKKSPLGIMNKQERFKINLSSQKDKIPGPGNYMQNRYTMVNEEEIRLNNKGSFMRKPQKAHDFGSAARASIRNHNQNPFGEYNVNQFDLAYKLMKQRQHHRRLKLMQVTLPAFNTKNHSSN